MQQGKLTHAWTTASAALPLGWVLMGVELHRSYLTVPGPNGNRNVESGGTWRAWADGEPGTADRVEATGSFPEQALYNLAEKLRQLRGDVNG